MELRHLSTFQTIVKEGSFLRAAEKLQYAQSTITLHVQQLEAELGIKLFARQGKRVQLTPAGVALREHADLLLQRATALQQSIQDIVTGEAGHLRIGATEPTASMRLPSLLVPFCQEHPQVKLTVETGSTQSISNRVASGDLDIGICAAPLATLGLSFEPLFVDKMALLLPEGHPLTSLEHIYPADLQGHRLLLTEKWCSYRSVIERELLSCGLNPYAGIVVGNVHMLRHAVQSHLGIAIVPSVMIESLPPGMVLRAITGIDLCLTIGLLCSSTPLAPPRVMDAIVMEIREQWGKQL